MVNDIEHESASGQYMPGLKPMPVSAVQDSGKRFWPSTWRKDVFHTQMGRK